MKYWNREWRRKGKIFLKIKRKKGIIERERRKIKREREIVENERKYLKEWERKKKENIERERRDVNHVKK